MSEGKRSVLLCAAGDVALGGSLEGHLGSPSEIDAYIGGVKPIFDACDLCFVDLDCTFDTSGIPPNPEEFLVSAEPAQLDLLVKLGVDIVSLANNHSTDYGGSSLDISRQHLWRRKIATVGAGMDIAEARRECVIERNGLRLGFLAYAATHPWVGAIPADAQRPGVAPMEPVLMEADVRRICEEVDCLIVSLHWGKEFLHIPPPENLDLARRLIEWGAGLVLGHHPHVIQGWRQYGKGIAFFSLGNFLYPDYDEQGLTFSGEQLESLVVQCRISEDGAQLERFVPVAMDENGHLVQLGGEREKEIRREIAEYSEILLREDYVEVWNEQVRRRELKRLWRVFDEEVLRVGWREGSKRLLQLGRKNFTSIGRSVNEILFGSGKGKG
jgi:poly-gamma-glutamate capsule biosynthesis protein CapA/YwtB (metallophosphatase superfamily)